VIRNLEKCALRWYGHTERKDRITEECNVLVILRKKKKKEKEEEEEEEEEEDKEEEKGKDIYIQLENILYAIMNISVFWDIMTFSSLRGNPHFGITYHLHLQGPTYKKLIMEDRCEAGDQITIAIEESTPMNKQGQEVEERHLKIRSSLGILIVHN
jgi:hypothetical protein